MAKAREIVRKYHKDAVAMQGAIALDAERSRAAAVVDAAKEFRNVVDQANGADYRGEAVNWDVIGAAVTSFNKALDAYTEASDA